MPPVRLVLMPFDKLGRFRAELDGRPLTKPTRQPFFDAARVLLDEGWPPDAGLEATHGEGGVVVLRSTVGEAAKWMIEERDRGGMRKVPWRPFAGTRQGPRTGAAAPEADPPPQVPDAPPCD